MLDQLRAAMQTCLLGPPTATVALRHDGAVAGVPTALDVLIRVAPDEADPQVLIGTAGMSAASMRGPIERAELMMWLDGEFAPAELEQLARALADLAVAPFVQRFPLRDEMILDDVRLPLFAGMSSAAVSPWPGDYHRLPGIEPPVRLLEITPLFAAEADAARVIGLGEAFGQMRRQRIDRRDPTRAEATLAAPAAAPVIAVTPRPTRPIDELVDRLESWLAAHAPVVHAELRPGAPEARLRALEERIGAACPAELRRWFARHDGEASLGSYRALAIDHALGTWQSWSRPDWLPVAEDGGGNLVCVDLRSGEVFFWEMQTGASTTRLPSFAAWLEARVVALEHGAFVVDERGQLAPRLEA